MVYEYRKVSMYAGNGFIQAKKMSSIGQTLWGDIYYKKWCNNESH